MTLPPPRNQAAQGEVIAALVAALGRDGAVLVTQRLGGMRVSPTGLCLAVHMVYGPQRARELRHALPTLDEGLYIPRSVVAGRRGNSSEVEAEVARLATAGCTNSSIASEMGLSERQVRRIKARRTTAAT